MIIIKNQETGFEHKVIPTIFPDGTSQVWKLPLEGFKYDVNKIIWYFQSEAELIHLIQLVQLLEEYDINSPEIYIPFLPYARQDKIISNQSTFALNTFMQIIMNAFNFEHVISSLDIHNDDETTGLLNYSASPYIKMAIDESDANVIVYPDAGAATRYQSKFDGIPYVILEKDRDQETGYIRGMKFSEETFHVDIEGKRLLIVDDICDGGATFIGAAKLLCEHEIDKLVLYVTHGIFSKGHHPLVMAGISELYTTKSLIKNSFGFDLQEF